MVYFMIITILHGKHTSKYLTEKIIGLFIAIEILERHLRSPLHLVHHSSEKETEDKRANCAFDLQGLAMHSVDCK